MASIPKNTNPTPPKPRLVNKDGSLRKRRTRKYPKGTSKPDFPPTKEEAERYDAFLDSPHSNSTLTHIDWRAIKEGMEAGVSPLILAEEHGISKNTIVTKSRSLKWSTVANIRRWARNIALTGHKPPCSPDNYTAEEITADALAFAKTTHVMNMVDICSNSIKGITSIDIKSPKDLQIIDAVMRRNLGIVDSESDDSPSPMINIAFSNNAPAYSPSPIVDVSSSTPDIPSDE